MAHVQKYWNGHFIRLRWGNSQFVFARAQTFKLELALIVRSDGDLEMVRHLPAGESESARQPVAIKKKLSTNLIDADRVGNDAFSGRLYRDQGKSQHNNADRCSATVSSRVHAREFTAEYEFPIPDNRRYCNCALFLRLFRGF